MEESTVRRIYRVRRDSLLGGICTGLGEYFRVDPVLIRLAWVVVTVFTGFVFGMVTYAVAWILVPAAPEVRAG